MKKNKNGQAPKTSGLLLLGSITSFVTLLLTVMAYASPYWLVSWEDTYSPFKKMGLWEFCFDHFRYPYYQFDKLFHGCSYVFSREYYVIWEWILPGWLMSVQAFMTLALIFICSSQIISSLMLTRWPLRFVFRYEYQLLGTTVILNALTAFTLFLAVAIFGGQCWRRDWLMYPNYNYLSWSYAFAVIAFFVTILSTLCFYWDSKRAWMKKRETRNLVVQMQPTPGIHSYI